MNGPKMLLSPAVNVVVTTMFASPPQHDRGKAVPAEERGAPIQHPAGQGRVLGGRADRRRQNDWDVPVYEDKAATDASLRALHRRAASQPGRTCVRPSARTTRARLPRRW